MKKTLTFLLMIALIASQALPVFANDASYVINEKPITVTYNADEILFPDAKPIIQNGRTLVPVRSILERAQLDVKFDAKQRTVTAARDDYSIIMLIDVAEAKLIHDDSEEIVVLEVPATIIDDRTYVPIRFIAQSLQAKVNWNPNYREVVIIDAAEWENEVCEKSSFLKELLSMPPERLLLKKEDNYTFLLSNKHIRLPHLAAEMPIEELMESSDTFAGFLKSFIAADDMLYTNSVTLLDAYFSLYSVFYSDNFFTTETQRNGTVTWKYKLDAEILLDKLESFLELHTDIAMVESITADVMDKASALKNQIITFKISNESITVAENAYIIDELLSSALESYTKLLFS